MNRIGIFVGLDYHQSAVQVCVMDSDGRVLLNKACRNDSLAIRDLVEPYGRVAETVIEACTGSANLAQELIDKCGWTVTQAHPGYVSRMKRGPDKSDFTDGRLLADLGRVGYVPRVWLPPQEIRDLRLLIRHRQQLANARRNAKLRICAVLRDQRTGEAGCNRWTKAWIHWVLVRAPLSSCARWVIQEHFAELESLNIRVRRVEDQLEAATREDRVVIQLMKTKGVGRVTAWTLRAMVGCFDRFDNGKQLSRFCGVTPCNASSGKRQADAGMVKAGDRQLRSVLIELAHSLIRYDDHWRAFAMRMRSVGKKTNVIAVAVANRWVRRLYHEMQIKSEAA